MQEIQFISFDNEGKPKTKVFKGKHIKDLLDDPLKPGKIIEEAWNEAEDLNTSLRELNDYDLVDCRQDLINRTNRIMETLNEIEKEED